MESGPNRVNAPLGGPVTPRSRRDLFKDQSFGDEEGDNANSNADRWHAGSCMQRKRWGGEVERTGDGAA